MVPILLFGAVVIGVACALAASGLWLLILARVPGKPRLARDGASLGAALVPIAVEVVPQWQLAIAMAVPAAILLRSVSR